jgi:hypothetical protein
MSHRAKQFRPTSGRSSPGHKRRRLTSPNNRPIRHSRPIRRLKLHRPHPPAARSAYRPRVHRRARRFAWQIAPEQHTSHSKSRRWRSSSQPFRSRQGQPDFHPPILASSLLSEPTEEWSCRRFGQCQVARTWSPVKPFSQACGILPRDSETDQSYGNTPGSSYATDSPHSKKVRAKSTRAPGRPRSESR